MSDSLGNFTVQKSTDNQQTWGPITENAFGLGPGVYPPEARQAHDATDPATLPSKKVWYRLLQTTAHGVTVPYSVPSLGVSASGSTAWANNFGGDGALGSFLKAVAVDPNNGNIFIAAAFSGASDYGGGSGSLTNHGGYDLVLASYTASGQFLWAKPYGTTGSETPYAIRLDSLGNIIVAGSYTGTANVGGADLPNAGTTAGTNDIWVAKYTPTGNPMWVKNFGGTKNDVLVGMAVDSQDNIVMAGFFNSPCTYIEPAHILTGGLNFGADIDRLCGGQSGNDLSWVAKISGADGSHIWSRMINGAGFSPCTGMCLDLNDDVFVVGTLSGTMSFGNGNADLSTVTGQGAFVGKLSGATGLAIWSKIFGAQDMNNYRNRARAVAADSSGDIYVLGDFNAQTPPLVFPPQPGLIDASYGGRSLFIVKLSGTTGLCAWAKQSDTVIGGVADPASIAVVGSNLVFTGSTSTLITFGNKTFTSIAGSTGGDSFVVNFATASGAQNWAVQFATTALYQYVTSQFVLAQALPGPGPIIMVAGVFLGGPVNFNGVAKTSHPSLPGSYIPYNYDAFLVKLIS